MDMGGVTRGDTPGYSMDNEEILSIHMSHIKEQCLHVIMLSYDYIKDHQLSLTISGTLLQFHVDYIDNHVFDALT